MKRKFEVENGAEPLPLEIKAANFLGAHGYKVLFLKAINKDGVNTPDIELDGIRFEIKSPTSNRPRTVNKRFTESLEQSVNVIMDLRYVKGDTRKLESLLEKWFKTSKHQKIIIITKQQKTIDFSK